MHGGIAAASPLREQRQNRTSWRTDAYARHTERDERLLKSFSNARLMIMTKLAETLYRVERAACTRYDHVPFGRPVKLDPKTSNLRRRVELSLSQDT